MELARETHSGLNLSAETEVLSYTYAGDEPKEVLARIDLGDDDKPIVGGTAYQFNTYINDVPIMPLSVVNVTSGSTRAIFVSRDIPLEDGDHLSITAIGASGDLDVDTVASLRDGTPLHRSEISGGGSVVVDHDYGGTNNLTVALSTGARVSGAKIRIYRSEDWEARNRAAQYVIAEVLTDDDGHWRSPVMLDPGSYTLLISKQGAVSTKVVNLTVE